MIDSIHLSQFKLTMTYSLMNVISDGFSHGISIFSQTSWSLRFRFNACFQMIHCIICRIPPSYTRHNQDASKFVFNGVRSLGASTLFIPKALTFGESCP